MLCEDHFKRSMRRSASVSPMTRQSLGEAFFTIHRGRHLPGNVLGWTISTYLHEAGIQAVRFICCRTTTVPIREEHLQRQTRCDLDFSGTAQTPCSSTTPLVNNAISPHVFQKSMLASSATMVAARDGCVLSLWGCAHRAAYCGLPIGQNQGARVLALAPLFPSNIERPVYRMNSHAVTRSRAVCGLHGMVSVMTAAESARDLFSAITHPVSYIELASHLARDYSVELFESLSGLVLCHLDELNGQELSNVLWAYGTAGHCDHGLMTCIMQSLLSKLPELGPVELANALWALSRLGLYDSQFISAASEKVWDALPAAAPRQLAAIVQSYAWFRQRDPQLEEDEDLLRGISARFRERLSTASATDIALTLSGMARLRRADAALLADACAALRNIAGDAGLPTLAEAVWALALLQHRDLELLEVIAERVAEALRQSTALVQAPPTSGGPAPSSVSDAQSQPSGSGQQGTVASAPQNTDTALGYGRMPGVEDACSVVVDVVAERGVAPVVAQPRRHDLPSSLPPPLSSALPPLQLQQQQHSLHQQQEHRSGPAVISQPKGKGQGNCADSDAACGGGGGEVTWRYAALWPTRLGPGGRIYSCPLYERFNPSLSDDWQGAAVGSCRSRLPGVKPPPGLPSQGGSRASPGNSPKHTTQGEACPHATPAQSHTLTPHHADAAALLDADVLSKLVWSYGVLHCYSSTLNTLVFRQLQRLHPEGMSWSTMARLMGAQTKVLELQPGQGICRINPLEAESATAWSRLMRARLPLHKLPERYLAPCFVAFYGEQMDQDCALPGLRDVSAPAQSRASLRQLPDAPLSRAALQAEVSKTLWDMDLPLRPSASTDGLFSLEHTVLINGLTICLEVLSAGCCTLDLPHRPMGPAVARLRSLEFRGWTPLVVPFYEWGALDPEDNSTSWVRNAGPTGEEEQLRAHQHTIAARKAYLRRKLEDLLGEELPAMPPRVPKR